MTAHSFKPPKYLGMISFCLLGTSDRAGYKLSIFRSSRCKKMLLLVLNEISVSEMDIYQWLTA